MFIGKPYKVGDKAYDANDSQNVWQALHTHRGKLYTFQAIVLHQPARHVRIFVAMLAYQS